MTATDDEAGPVDTGPAPPATTDRADDAASEAYPEEPTPYDPTILVFRHAPWITTPGIYPGISDVEYHLDPVVGGSVSSTVLRIMTPPVGTPWHGHYYLTEGRKDESYYDVGSGYHTRLLGTGGEITVVDAQTWQGSAARAIQTRVRREGGIPLLTKEAKLVDAMVAATLTHPECARMFVAGTFTAELVIVWQDEATGVMCRAKIDAIPDYAHRLRFVDLKTKFGHADPGSVSTTIEKRGYHQQFALYEDGIRAMIALGLLAPVESIEPFLVICGKEPPHVPLARLIDQESIEIGRIQNRKALDLYATCRETGEWPGYDTGKPKPIGLPHWAKTRFDFEFRNGTYDPEEIV